jgi:ribosomal protein S24E
LVSFHSRATPSKEEIGKELKQSSEQRKNKIYITGIQ